MKKQSSVKYTLSGKGPAVVLIHGFCESKDIWKDYHQQLQNKYTIITPDLPGFGESPLQHSEVSIEYFADQIHELLMSLQVENIIMIGHSLGGYVTLAYAEKYPHMLKGFGLFHSTAFADSEDKKINRDRTIDFIKKHGVAPFAESFVEPLFFMRNRKHLEKQILLMKEQTKNTSQESIISTTIAMRDRIDRTEVLKKASCPVLFIVGKEDGPVPLNKSLEQCYLPIQSVVHFFSECGHMGMYEKKEETLMAVNQFIELCLKKSS
ncbi:MAG: alpha/beta fold hydrolase [Cytophagaceae bacterium]